MIVVETKKFRIARHCEMAGFSMWLRGDGVEEIIPILYIENFIY